MRQQQRGISLIGLLFWAVLIAFSALVTMKVLPTVNEYYTIRSTVSKIARGNPATVALARAEFERQKQIEYSIDSIEGKDLGVSKEGDRVVISFAYEKQIALMGPVYLLIKYEGRSD
jgi:hypothetical protein